MKNKIEDINAQAEGPHRLSVYWRIGADRYHVWIASDGKPEDTIFKRSVAKRGEPGYYHRARTLNPATSKNAAAMLHEVWAFVTRNNLIRQAKQIDSARRAQSELLDNLYRQQTRLEDQALDCWKRGELKRLPELHGHYVRINANIKEVSGSA